VNATSTYSAPATCPHCAARFAQTVVVHNSTEVQALQDLLAGATLDTHLGLLRVRRGRLERCMVDVGLTNDATNPETTTPAWVESHLTVTDFMTAARRMK
jgi:hypothetical protein